MIDQVIAIIRENNRIPEEVAITRDSKLDTDIGLSSFDLMECLAAIEEMYQVELPREKVPEFSTLGDVMDCLEEALKHKNA